MSKTAIILKFVFLALAWAALVALVLRFSQPITLYTAFVVVASGIIVFVPMWKKYGHELRRGGKEK